MFPFHSVPDVSGMYLFKEASTIIASSFKFLSFHSENEEIKEISNVGFTYHFPRLLKLRHTNRTSVPSS